MPIIAITDQPATNDVFAAYRPISLSVMASRTDGNAIPPLVYCDIYLNGTYYKTQERTQYESASATFSIWQFFIEDACQEVLSSTIAANGGSAISMDAGAMVQVYCKFRSSGFDINGFIAPEGTQPIQGTGTILPVAGSGTQSTGFLVANSTLQHDQNQDLTTHLGFYKGGTWDAAVFPLSHRPNGYRVAVADSDYFPIINLGSKDPLCIKLFYKNKGDLSYSSISKCGDGGCTAVNYAAFSFADAVVGTAYSKTVPITGTGPFTLTSFTTGAAWLSATVTGSNLVFTGTPAMGDVGTGVAVNFILTNTCGSIPAYKTMNVVSGCVAASVSGSGQFPNGYSGKPYESAILIQGSGPFTISAITAPSWLTLVIDSGDNQVLGSGNPSLSDVATSVPVSFTVSNACGSYPYTDSVTVLQSGVRFTDPTGGTGDALNYSETSNVMGGQPYATITLTLDSLTNSNGGKLLVNGYQVFLGTTINVVLDPTGSGSFTAAIQGLAHNNTGIVGHFTISSTTAGTIGVPDYYIISKAFS